jgi:hypothetical protein
VPQEEVVEKLKVHLQNPKNSTKLGIMRFLSKQMMPENLDKTYFGTTAPDRKLQDKKQSLISKISQLFRKQGASELLQVPQVTPAQRTQTVFISAQAFKSTSKVLQYDLGVLNPTF